MIEPSSLPTIALKILLILTFGCGSKNKDSAPDAEAPAGGATCLAGCDRPSDASFSFTERIVNLGANCDIRDASLINTGGTLLLVHRSDCGGGVQLYVNTLDATYTGSVPTLLSQQCFNSGWNVIDFSVGKGSDRVLSFGVCQTSLTSASTYVFANDFSGQKTGSKLFASYSGLDLTRVKFPHKYASAWNDAAGAFGIASSDDTFRRLDRSLGPLGGSFPTSLGSSVSIAVRDNQWYVVDDSYCKRFDTGGVIGCDTVLPYEFRSAVIGFDGTRRAFNSSYRSTSYSTLNPLNCTFAESGSVAMEGDSAFMEIDGVKQSHNFPINDKYLGLSTLDQNNRLLLHILSTSTPVSKVSVVSVADGINSKLIQPIIANKRISIPIIRQGILTIAESDKAVN